MGNIGSHVNITSMGHGHQAKTEAKNEASGAQWSLGIGTGLDYTDCGGKK
jgi:hypothetical protein